MIAHVAEASEQRGRVVLWLDAETLCRPQDLDAAVRLASAYGAEVETIFISPDAVIVEEGVPARSVAHVVSGDAPEEAANDQAIMRSELLWRRLKRAAEIAGRTHGVAVHHALAQGNPIDRIAEMCLARGPWNIVAFTGLPAFGGHIVMNELMANVGGATGFLLCSGGKVHAEGPILIFAEDAERLPAMLRAGERLSSGDSKIHLVIAAETRPLFDDLDAHARLLADETYNVTFDPSAPTLGVPATLIEAAARLRPSLIIAPFAGAAIVNGRELARLAVATQAPILVVR